MYHVTILLLLSLLSKGLSLMCMQCNVKNLQPYQLDNETVEKCRQGTIQPTPCADPSSTHCILSYFSKDSKKTIRERRCGILSDINGCQTYYNYGRKNRHLIGVERPKSRSINDAPLLEVCVVGCAGDNCTIDTAASRRIQSPSLSLIVTITLMFHGLLFRR